MFNIKSNKVQSKIKNLVNNSTMQLLSTFIIKKLSKRKNNHNSLINTIRN